MARILPVSSARRGFAAIASGAALGQVILVAAAPFLGRIYNPDVFGAFSVVNAIVLAAGTVAALRFELAVPLSESDGEARGIVRLGIRLALGVALVCTPLVYLSRGSLAEVSGWSGDVINLMVWAPLGAGMLGIYLVLNQLAVRQRAYGAIARRNVLQAITTVALQVGLGVAGWGSVGLVFGLILGQAAGVIALAWTLRGALPLRSSDTQSMRELVSKYRSFPLILAPSGLINTLGLQAPLLAVTSLYGNTSAGSFGMAQRVLAIPVTLIGVAISQVFVGELAARKRGGHAELLPLFVGVSKRLAAVGLAGGLVVLLAAPALFTALLGSEWATGGHMARALAVGLMIQLVAAPLSQSAIIAGKNVIQLLWDIGRLILCTLVVVMASRAGLSDVSAVWCLGAATAVCYGASWLISWWAVQGMDGRRRMDSATLAT